MLLAILLGLQILGNFLMCVESIDDLEEIDVSNNEVDIDKRISDASNNKVDIRKRFTLESNKELYIEILLNIYDSADFAKFRVGIQIPDSKCHLPLIIRGFGGNVEYSNNNCKREVIGARSYCSTTGEFQRDKYGHMKTGHGKFCLTKGKELADPNKWKLHPSCEKLFSYRQQYFKGCTNVNGKKPWCAHVVRFNRIAKWSYCINIEKTDGKWSQWSQWTQCKKSCGEEFQKRNRSCSAPRPQNGKDCVGRDKQRKYCRHKLCPTDGKWSQWSQWTQCKKSCGEEFQSRSRSCTNTEKKCEGVDNQEKYCRHKLCPIDGNWSHWNEWSHCKKSCGDEYQKRTRSCTDPSPEYLGKNCEGDDNELRSCNNEKCSVDGKWTQWSQWSKCRKSCGDELKRRSRSCTNPSPIYPGMNCAGDDNESKSCNNEICPGDMKKMSNKGEMSNIIFAILVSMGAVFVVAFVVAAVIYRKRRRRYSDSSSEQSYLYQESDSD